MRVCNHIFNFEIKVLICKARHLRAQDETRKNRFQSTGPFIRKFECRSWWSNTQFLLDQIPFCPIKCVFIKLQYYGRRFSENFARSRWSSKQILSDHMCFCSIIWSVIGLINDPDICGWQTKGWILIQTNCLVRLVRQI